MIKIPTLKVYTRSLGEFYCDRVSYFDKSATLICWKVDKDEQVTIDVQEITHIDPVIRRLEATEFTLQSVMKWEANND